MESPQFLRKFSKENSKEERDQLAAQIKRQRARNFDRKEEIEDLSSEISELDKNIEDKESSLEKTLEELQKLNSEISNLSENGIEKIVNYFKIKSLQRELDTAVQEKNSTQYRLENDKSRKDRKKDDLKTANHYQENSLDPEEMLRVFYKKEERKWSNLDYSKEDIGEYFSEEYLAKLSLEDYIILMKRFPSEFVTHVTRQGIRDHLGHAYHTAGKGEYADGFKKMLEDGALRSPLAVKLIEDGKEEAIKNFLYLDKFESAQEAWDYHNQKQDRFFSERQGGSGTYVDRSAIHFATEQVADSYYGSEKGNEIFVVYPSLHVASKYHFSGTLTESGGGYWNDQWVWAKEEEGMGLDAGIVFISKEVRVNPETGSRYKLDENNNPIENKEYDEKIRSFVMSDDFDQFAEDAMEISGRMRTRMFEVAHLYPDNLDQLYDTEVEKVRKLEPFTHVLIDKFGIDDHRLAFSILNYNKLLSLKGQKKRALEGKEDEFGSIDSVKDDILKEVGMYFVESKETVSAEEYWNSYFDKHPDQKPSKIVYYEGINPTEAFRKWKKENGLTKKGEKGHLGFEERNVDRNSPEARVGLERFKSLAKKVIEDYYQEEIVESIPT